MRLGTGLGLTLTRGPALGPELRASGAPGLTGTATAATYDTGTGAGTVTRVDLSNQSYIAFLGLAAGGTYRVTLTAGAASVVLRQTPTGTVVATVPAGQTLTADVSTGAGTSLYVAAAAAGTVSFTVESLRKVG